MMDTGNDRVERSLEEALSEHDKMAGAVQRAGADTFMKDLENHRAGDLTPHGSLVVR